MTDRFSTLTVVLETDIREDDAEHLVSAIRQLRGVLNVSGNVSDISEAVAQARVRRELTDRLWNVIHPKDGS